MTTSAPSLEGLRVLQEREQAERDTAAMRLAEAREAAAGATEQARQLLEYRDEYERRWSAQFRQGTPAELLQCHRSFLDRLELAVTQQATLAQHARDRVDVQRQHAQVCEQRLAAVTKLIARREATWQHAQMRVQQRLSDEVAQRQHSRRARHGESEGIDDTHEHTPWPP